jgi:amino acid transporter
MLLGLAVLARRWHIGPRSDQTVLSQIMAMAVGRHWAYYVVSLTITVVLALAANTSFGGLPILASLLARDDYLPHLFSLRDDRQVFGNGIWVLAGLSAALLATSLRRKNWSENGRNGARACPCASCTPSSHRWSGPSLRS